MISKFSLSYQVISYDNQISCNNQVSYNNQVAYNNQISYNNQVSYNNQILNNNQISYNNQMSYNNQISIVLKEALSTFSSHLCPIPTLCLIILSPFHLLLVFFLPYLMCYNSLHQYKITTSLVQLINAR